MLLSVILTCLKSRAKFLLLILFAYAACILTCYQIQNGNWRSHDIIPDQTTAAAHFRKRLRYVFENHSSGSNNSNDDHSTPLYFDVHLEDAVRGHTGDVYSVMLPSANKFTHGNVSDVRSGLLPGDIHTEIWSNPERRKKTIAIGCGVTSKKLKNLTSDNIQKRSQLFSVFLPTFCKTASSGYEYHFYFAYDHSDAFFTNTRFLAAFVELFRDTAAKLCRSKGITPPFVHVIQCSHSGHPAWAQNDAMVEAYLDGMEYFYRVNDDSKMVTKGWAEAFIKVLSNYDPPNVGVVGPAHKGGNTAILTYDFTHRTHLDIFGVYYPRLFKDWWGDNWMTKVYQPGRSTKLAAIRLTHTMKMGRRYNVSWEVGAKRTGKLETDRKILQRYLSVVEKRQNPSQPNGSLVIAMSLFGQNPLYTMGAVRNAQLLPVHFPGWVLRVYVPNPGTVHVDPDILVPGRILFKLNDLGVQIAYVNASQNLSCSPKLWNYLVADDQDAQYFLIRNAHNRLSDRDANAVNEWIQKNNSVLHCVRDHPEHAKYPVVDGLWGAKAVALRNFLPTDMLSILKNRDKCSLAQNLNPGASPDDVTVLRDVLWPLVKDHAYCHDSIACDKWPRSVKFSTPRNGLEYLGESFTEYQERADQKWKQLKSFRSPDKCVDFPEEGTVESPMMMTPSLSPILSNVGPEIQNLSVVQNVSTSSDQN